MNILLAVDGSKPSLAAVDLVIRTFGELRSKPEVELLTVHLSLPRMRVNKEQLAKYYEEEGEANLAPARKKLDSAGIRYNAKMLVGPIAETIVKQAAESKCDLICMGCRGMGEIAHALLGSTTTKVLHLSKQPVLIAK
jgi:nucleotide-binding universal stress UspA family protein